MNGINDKMLRNLAQASAQESAVRQGMANTIFVQIYAACVAAEYFAGLSAIEDQPEWSSEEKDGKIQLNLDRCMAAAQIGTERLMRDLKTSAVA